MRNRNLEIVLAYLCIIDILAGTALGVGIFEGSINARVLGMYTVLMAIWTLMYLVLEIRWVRRKNRGVLSRGWQFSCMINTSGMAVVGVLFLGPMHSSYVGSNLVALLLLQDVLPVLLILQYLAGPKHKFSSKQILPAMIPALLYDVAAVILGQMGYGLSVSSGNYPYPFLNVDQLGMGLVIANIGMMMAAMFVYCWIWIGLDHIGAHND